MLNYKQSEAEFAVSLAYQRENILSEIKYGRGSIIFWGCSAASAWSLCHHEVENEFPSLLFTPDVLRTCSAEAVRKKSPKFLLDGVQV